MPTFRHESGIPVLSGDPARDIEALRNAFYELESELRYMFLHLDTENFNDGFTRSIEEKIGDITKGLQLDVSVDGLLLELTERGPYKELSNSIKMTAAGLTKTIQRVETVEDNYIDSDDVGTILRESYNITTETADGFSRKIVALETDVEDLGKTISDQYTEFEQTVNGITLKVKTASGTTLLKLADGTLDLSGLVSFSDLSGAGKTTINGSNITTGVINASLITAGTLKSINIEGVDITGSSLRSEGTSGGYTSFVDISAGKLLGGRYSGSITDSDATGFWLDGNGLSLGKYTDPQADMYVSSNVFHIAGKSGICFDNDVTFSGNAALSKINNTAFPGGFSLSQFGNNAIAMATASTTTAGTVGGSGTKIDLQTYTEKDTAEVFSSARYSSTYGYGIRCSKAGYYLVSAHANLKTNAANAGATLTLAIGCVVSGTNTYIAKTKDYSSPYSTQNVAVLATAFEISPRVVYLSENSYLWLYNSSPYHETDTDGCWITAIYLGI